MTAALTAARAIYERHAQLHPAKAARYLASIEDTLARLPESGDSPRLVAIADGLRAGLDAAVRCRRCGRVLTNPVSKARKLGSECVRKAER